MDEKGREPEPSQPSVAAEKPASAKVIAVTPAPSMRPQAAYADQPKRMSILDRLNEKKAEVANRQKPVVSSAHKKEQTL